MKESLRDLWSEKKEKYKGERTRYLKVEKEIYERQRRSYK